MKKRLVTLILNVLLKNDKFKTFLTTFILDIHKIEELTFTLDSSSLLLCQDCKNGNRIRISRDLGMFNYVLQKQSWDEQIPLSIFKFINKTKRYSVIDAGANIGLISRQLRSLDTSGCIDKFILIEPNDNCYSSLEFNSKALKNYRIRKCILGVDEHEKRFYVNKDSFNNTDGTALEEIGEKAGFTSILTASITLDTIMTEDLNDMASQQLIFKSDLQGYDVFIISNASKYFFDRCAICVFEIMPEYFPAESEFLEKLLNNLQRFDKFFLLLGDQILQIKLIEMAKYVKNRSIGYFDLFAIKD